MSRLTALVAAGQTARPGKRRTGAAGGTAGGGNQGVERGNGGWNFLNLKKQLKPRNTPKTRNDKALPSSTGSSSG